MPGRRPFSKLEVLFQIWIGVPPVPETEVLRVPLRGYSRDCRTHSILFNTYIYKHMPISYLRLCIAYSRRSASHGEAQRTTRLLRERRACCLLYPLSLA